MLKKLICKIFGHDWKLVTNEEVIYTRLESKMAPYYYECKRCNKKLV